MPAHSRAARSLPIRPTLIGMFTVPLISLVALWVFAATTSINNATHEHSYRTIAPRVQPLLIGLSQERGQSYLWLITGRRSPKAPVDGTRVQTDKAVSGARMALDSIRGELTSQASTQLDGFFGQLGRLGTIRRGIDAGTTSPATAFQAYSDIVDAAFHFFDTTIQVDNASLYQASIGTTDGSYAVEMAGRELALAGGALAARGRMSTADRALFASTVAGRRLLVSDALALLNPGLRAGYASANDSPTYQRLAAMENRISASVGSASPVPVDPRAWEPTATSYLTAMEKASVEDLAMLDTSAAQVGDRLVTLAVLTGGLGLVAVVASVVLLLWFGRRVTGDLTRLRDNVRAMADERLPRVVERLRRGDEVDVSEESPPPSPGRITEIARVAEAFATVQAAAVEAAVNQAKLRKRVNRVFLNLSMRSQSLLHRQLSMLDAMERRTAEPEALDELFRLDHLTTRMRRHAEGLIILSGSAPARGWREPVPVIDVLRAAVAEVEDYTRVDVISLSRDTVAGNAANDVIHLVAELIENAATFSPPNTRIEVRTVAVASGLAAEIEDRGLGIPAGELAQLNEHLASPPEFDLDNTERLGLFIVGQLAARHGIKVSLRESAFGGTTAIVLMPFGVVAPGDDAHRQAGAAEQVAETRRVSRRRRAALEAARHAGERSPEATGNLIASMQQGWQRGRVDELRPSDSESRE
jgi:signal transduction histidine kinase